MEVIQPGSKINYNANGENTSFQLQTGKKIRIPSKQFADSLFYELNFRHDKFLVPDISSTMGALMVAPAFNEIITNMTTPISAVLKQEVIDLYKETCQFFINALNFVKNFLSLQWLPRGTGGVLGKGIGLTFTSVTGNIYNKSTLWRKMTPVDELNIMFKDEITLGAGPDVAYGVNLGLYFGKGNKKKGIGIQAGVGANAQLNFKLNTEYEFPIRAQETALLSMIVTVFGGPVAQSVTNILDYLEVINLDPKKYVTKYDCGLELNGEAWGAAEANLGSIESNNGINVADEPVNDANTGNKGFFTLDKLSKIIPSVGITATLKRSFGLGFSIEYEYDQNCLIPDIKARVPEKIKVEIFYQSKMNTDVGLLGSTLSRIIFGASGIPAGFNAFLALIFGNKDKKYSFLFEGKRNVNGKEINYDDVSIHNFNTSQYSVTNNSKGGLKYQKNNNNKFTWESYFKIGYFSGDPESFCQPGSMSAIKLNLTKIKDLYSSNNLTLSQVLEVFYSYEYGFKLGHGIDGRNKKGLSITQNVAKSYRKVGTTTSFNFERAVKSEILSSVYKKFTVQASAFIYVKIELEMEKILPIVKYYLKVAKKRFDIPDDILFLPILNNLINHRKKVIEAINKKVKSEDPLNEEQLLTKLGSQYFDLLFSESTTPIHGGVVGMNAYIDQLPATSSNVGNAMKVFVDSYNSFLDYFSDKKIKTTINNTYGIHDIAMAFSYTKNLLNLFVALEVELGIAASTNLKAGQLATYGFSLAGEIALIVNSTFYEKGMFVLPNNPNDDLNQAHREIKDKIYNEVMELSGRVQEVKKSLVRHLIPEE